MTAHEAMQIFLPMMNPAYERDAFSVARVMTKTWKGRLHFLASMPLTFTVQDCAQRLAVPPQELRDTTCENLAGNFADALVKRVNASELAMVVLAATVQDKRPGQEHSFDEEIARRLLEKINCPVVIVPPGRDMQAWQLHRELLPQDGTPDCAAALAQVINQSRQLGIENLILRVAGANVSQPTDPGSLATPRYVDHPQYEWESWSREFLDRIVGMGADLNLAGLRIMVATGEPAAEILRVAQEQSVDLIIMPWHCILHSGRARMIKAVLDGAICPVMLLPECGSPLTLH